MKINTTIGNDQEKVTVKEYPSGMKIVTEGDSSVVDTWTRNKPSRAVNLNVDKEEKKKLLEKPDNFKIKGNRLVRKGKNK